MPFSRLRSTNAPHRAIPALLVGICAWISAILAFPSQTATSSVALETLDRQIVTLESRIQSGPTLLLVVGSEPDLRRAQKALTLAEVHQLQTFIVITLSPDAPIQSAAIRRAAKRFFASDFSRKRVCFAPAESIALFGDAKSLYFQKANAQQPIWISSSYPEETDFQAPPFAERSKPSRPAPKMPAATQSPTS